MNTDDETLLDALASALPADRQPSEEQVAAFRRQVQNAAPTEDGALPTFGWQSWLAAAVVALIVGFGAFLAVRDSGVVEFDGPMVSASDEVDAEIRVVAVGIGREITFRTDELPILPTGEYYELWFVGEGDGGGEFNRISAGTFHPDLEGRSDIEFVAAVDPDLYPRMEITAEPGDGNPLPTGPVVLTADIP